MWDEMEKVILDIADIHCPYKSYHERAALSPWLSQDLLELIKDRDRLYKLAKRSSNQEDWVISRKARNKCNRGIKHAKDEYVKSQLVAHEKNPHKFWLALKAVCAPADTSANSISLVDSSSGSLLADHEVPEAFSTHLCGVGQRLAKKFGDGRTPFHDNVLPFLFTFAKSHSMRWTPWSKKFRPTSHLPLQAWLRACWRMHLKSYCLSLHSFLISLSLQVFSPPSGNEPM